MKKTNYESLIEQKRPRPDALDRAARLEEASRNLETLAALSRAEAEARTKKAEIAEPAAEPATSITPVIAPTER